MRARVDPQRGGGVPKRGKSGDSHKLGSAEDKARGTSSARAVGSTGLETGYVEVSREDVLAGLSNSEIDNFDWQEFLRRPIERHYSSNPDGVPDGLSEPSPSFKGEAVDHYSSISGQTNAEF